MINLAVLVVPLYVALIVTNSVMLTWLVVTVKAPVVSPAATVALGGAEAAGELLDSVTVTPPAGAAALRVTVPVDELPPVTVVGFSDTELKATAAGGLMVSEAD